MTNTKLIIPQKINVGFQERKGTYTGKLAYVIYWDKKGVLRKERSWEGWRDKKITNEEFVNEPTDGFVLNKKVGDYRSRFGGRSAWIRIYDPRGFEFEISVQNLIFILEECSSIKGKGLEGEFVYSWNGKDLVLLPVDSVEYKESFEYTNLQTKKITKKDMEEGCLYKTKENETVMYLGRHIWYNRAVSGKIYSLVATKFHIFVKVDNKTYWLQKGFTKLASKFEGGPSADYPNSFDKFKKDKHSSPLANIHFEKAKLPPVTYCNSNRDLFVSKDGNYFRVILEKTRGIREYYLWVSKKPTVLDNGRVESPMPINTKRHRYSYDVYDYKTASIKTYEQLSSIHFYKGFIKTKNGALVSLERYYYE